MHLCCLQAADDTNGASGYPDASKARVDWTPFLFGFIPHIAAWSIVACHFFRNVAEGGDTPGFVWAIIFILFILDGMFALVQFLQFRQVKLLRGFARAEFFYIILRCADSLFEGSACFVPACFAHVIQWHICSHALQTRPLASALRGTCTECTSRSRSVCLA